MGEEAQVPINDYQGPYHVLVVSGDEVPAYAEVEGREAVVELVRAAYNKAKERLVRDCRVYVFQGRRIPLTGGPTRALVFGSESVAISEPPAGPEYTDVLLAPSDQ